MFTPAVKEVQARMGSRGANERFDDPDAPAADRLGPAEREFIAARDSFYMATVSESGWPYVQHRGGPSGFLKVIDARTIGFADYRGNRQYVSVGNLTRDDRVSLILVDYLNRRRLKIVGRSRLVDPRGDPELVARFRDEDYGARVERAVVIDIEGFDWNCPQHITPRFTEAELAEARALVLGSGPLEVEIVGVAALAHGVRGYRLRSADRAPLPAWSAGAHIPVPVVLPDGTETTRQYSLAGDPARRDAYEFAVLDVEGGRGGSRYVHRHYAVGTRLRIEAPRNRFALDPAHAEVTLIAGGIGVTPIRSMVLALRRAGACVALHYVGRSRERMAYLDELLAIEGLDLKLHVTGEGPGGRPEVSALVPGYADGRSLYVCGPPGLIAWVRDAAKVRGWPARAVRFERFSAPTPAATGKPFELVLARSGSRLAVDAGESALEALENAGLPVPSSCRSGICGNCAVKVTGGEPEHRDSVLSEDERAAGRFCTCVSRARGPALTVDL
jgi:ferredoxin-NADP reductase/predicted pyridoxine 5'-phosphate oxidase superfamily flavin-nucleotide-binding protein